jgi:thiaminase
MALGPKYEEYQRIKRENATAREWLAHIGATGRGSDILNLSSAHAAVKLVIAGQYTTGGNNYRDSPKPFNDLLIRYIHENFGAIKAVIEAAMEEREEKSKQATREELEAALSELAADAA